MRGTSLPFFKCSTCEPSTYYTSYCHLQSSSVAIGQTVVRGEAIARLGHTGTGSAGVSHVHLSMCTAPCVTGSSDGQFEHMLDPMSFDDGCFQPARDYPMTTRPILTHPIVCTGR